MHRVTSFKSTAVGKDSDIPASLAQRLHRLGTLKRLLLLSLLLLSLIGLALLIYLRGIGVFDDSIFYTVAEGITRGAIYPIDLFDIKPPGLYYTLAVVTALFGKAWWIPRTFLLFVDILFIGLFLWFASRHLSRNWSIWAGVIFCLSLAAAWGYQPNVRAFAAIPGSLGLVLVYGSNYKSTLRNACYGLLAGIATLYHQTGVGYLVAFIIVYSLLMVLRRSFTVGALLRLVAVMLAYLIPLLIVSLYYWYQDGLDELAQALFFQVGVWLESKEPDIKSIVSQLSRFPALGAMIIGILLAVSRRFESESNLRVVLRALALNATQNRGDSADGEGENVSSSHLLSALAHPNILLWIVAIIFMLPILPVRVFPHYLAPTAFPISFLAAYAAVSSVDLRLDKRPSMPSLRKIILLTTMILFILVFWWAGPLRMIRHSPLPFDMAQGREIYVRLSECIQLDDPVLVVASSSPRLYYISQHLPPWPYIVMDASTHGLVSWDDAIDLIRQEQIPAVLLEGRPGAGPNPPGPYLPEFRPVLARSYVPIPLQHALHPVHGTTTELYVLRTLPCDLPPQENPLFP